MPTIPDEGIPVSWAPDPENEPENVVALIVDADTVPVSVGLSESTLQEVALPVDVKVPVPPLATGNTPDAIDDVGRLVKLDPSPLIFPVAPISRVNAGLGVLMPINPLALVKNVAGTPLLEFSEKDPYTAIASVWAARVAVGMFEPTAMLSWTLRFDCTISDPFIVTV